MAILNPKWIASEILRLPKGTSVDMELGIGPALSVRAKIADLYFIPSNERLIVNPSKEDEKLFQLVDKSIDDIYRTLSYTPIEAIGYNFLYELEENENFVMDVDFEASHYDKIFATIKASAGTESVIQHSLSLSEDAHVILNLQHKISAKRKFLTINYHYQTNNDKERIKNSLAKFYLNYKHSKLIFSKLIKK